MTLDQLQIFVAVAERSHMTRAATALGMTQSAISAAIAALESRYRARLFDRVGRTIELTETGRRFLQEARAVLERAAIARSVLEDLGSSPTGTIVIAASQTIASYWLPKRLATFHVAHPGVKLDVMIRNTREVEQAVADGSVQIGLVEGPTHHRSLARDIVDTDRLVLVVAGAHPPLPRRRGRLDLTKIAWVVREEGSGTRHVLEEFAAKQGFLLQELNIFLVLPDNEAIREAVEAGTGATIISEHVVASSLAAGRLRAHPIDFPPREFAILQHRERHVSLAQQALLEHLTQPAVHNAR